MVAFTVALRFPPQASQEVPQQAIVAFHGIRLRFGLGMKGVRNHVFIGLPVVTHNGLKAGRVHGVP